MDLQKAIQKRKSVKHFGIKKPDWRDIIECIDTARYAPMAGNLFSLKFILVDDHELIAKLADASQQPFIAEAQYVVVACSDCKKTLNAYAENAEKFCRQQAGAAIQNFLLSLEEKGLDTCWIGYFVDYLVKECLNVPEGIEIEALFPIGKPSTKRGTSRKSTRKIDLDRILYFNKWEKERMKKEKAVEERRFGRKLKE